ncbi:MAG: ester cyclase [Pseudomonadota bacterium]
MSNEALAEAYFAAWIAHDADAILSTLGPEGTYEDPGTGGPIKGEAFRAYVTGLWSAFPDLTFRIESHAATGPSTSAAQWVMRGTNTGPMRGAPPTGRTVEVRGADFFAFRDGRIASVTGYFDSAAVPRQIGLDVIVQPSQVGPFRFGISTVVQTGKRDVPGAVSLTHLEARGPEEILKVRADTRATLIDMLKMDGFIGATTSTAGNRMVTITAWKDADSARRVMREGAHAQAMKGMLSGELADAGRTSVWVLERDNGALVRCSSCGKMTRSPEPGAPCRCGADLPPPAPFW